MQINRGSLFRIASVLACVATLSQASPNRFTEKQTVLGPLDRSQRVRVFVSPNQRHVAWLQQVGNQMEMVVDGVPGRQFNWIEDPVFSPDGSRVTYVGRIGTEAFLVDDGRVSPPYLDVHKAKFSLNSRREVYVVNPAPNEMRLIIDGKMQPARYRSISEETLSPDGTSIAFCGAVGPTGADFVLVHDAAEGTKGGIVTDVTFSPDGRHLAAVAQRDLGRVVILDGKEGPPYQQIAAPQFSADSSQLAYEGKQGDALLMVVDGKPQKAWWSILHFEYSPKGHRYQYIALKGPDLKGGMTAVVDGTEIGSFSDVGGPVFSSDGSRLAFSTSKNEGGPMTMWVDGVLQPPFPKLGFAVFSPDGKRIAYSAEFPAERGPGARAIILDGRAQKSYDYVGDPVFSPDSRHVAYEAFRRNQFADKHMIVVDGIEGAGYFLVRPPIFSPDGTHCAYFASTGRNLFAVVDGQETEPFESLPGARIDDRPVFDAPDRLHFLVMRSNQVVRIELRLNPAN